MLEYGFNITTICGTNHEINYVMPNHPTAPVLCSGSGLLWALPSRQRGSGVQPCVNTQEHAETTS